MRCIPEHEMVPARWPATSAAPRAFLLALPRLESLASEVQRELPMQRGSILLVDDEIDLRGLFSRVLRKEGYAVEEADSGKTALELARSRAPDLVLLDLYLPDMSGLDVLERILRENPSARVVLMTGNAEIETAVRAMKLGAIDYLLKPFDKEKLAATVRALLAGGGEREPGLARPIVGESTRMSEVWAQVARYAIPDVSILLLGESGTGKELFARAIHDRSKRFAKPFIALDCATLPETLVESEIFGHEKGAFTGASERKIGKFEMAHRGTLFLDEIGNLPLHVQAKLLRVLQERTIDRLGGGKPIEVDVRIVAATNLDVEQAIRKGTFRDDLYYRLAEVVLRLPPLRERQGDVRLLVDHFVEQFNRRFDRKVRGFAEPALRVLLDYAWPGNVRELENAVKSSLLAADDLIAVEHLPQYLRSPATAPGAERDDLRGRVRAAVDAGLERGSIDLKGLAAGYAERIESEVLAELMRRRRFTQAELSQLLGIDPKTLRAKLQKIETRGDSRD